MGYSDIFVSEDTKAQSKWGGISVRRNFTTKGVHPFDQINWEKRTASISNEKGEVIFQQDDVEVPDFWSMTATNVVVSKYFHGQLGTPQREHSIKQIVDRVARTFTRWGIKGGYFASNEDASTFYDELTYLLVNQHVSFNSPVWFNVGIEDKPQCSACFINSVKDTMESILDLAKTEGMLFKWGAAPEQIFRPLNFEGKTFWWWYSFGSGFIPARVRLIRGSDKIRRENAPRRKDGYSKRRAP